MAALLEYLHGINGMPVGVLSLSGPIDNGVFPVGMHKDHVARDIRLGRLDVVSTILAKGEDGSVAFMREDGEPFQIARVGERPQPIHLFPNPIGGIALQLVDSERAAYEMTVIPAAGEEPVDEALLDNMQLARFFVVMGMHAAEKK